MSPDQLLPRRMVLGARLVFGALALYVTVNSLLASPDIPDSGMALTRWLAALIFGSADHADKVSHFLAYGALGFFAAASRFTAMTKAWIIAFGLATYGLLIELAQWIGGARQGSWLDVLANMAGSISGVTGFFIVAFIIVQFLHRRSTS